MKIRKIRHMLVWFMLLILLCIPPLSVTADSTITDQYTASGFRYWEYSNSSVGFRGEYVQILGYEGDDTETLEIPSVIDGKPVISVSGVFKQRRYPGIQRIVFAEGIFLVGNLQLANLPNLTEIVLPQSLKVIDSMAFQGAPVTDITIPSGVGHIVSMDESYYDNFGGAPFDATVTLHGNRGSYIERYAAVHGLAFEPIVYEPSIGDVNADGVCNSTDARLILQHTVKKITFSSEEIPFADVDGNGKVDSTDARLCLQYAVGKSESDRITVSTAFPSSNLISSQATVYAFSWPIEGEYPDLPQYPQNTLLTVNRREAIAIANRAANGSYYTNSNPLGTLTQFSMTFIEPNGSCIEFQLRRSCGWVMVYNGNAFGDFGSGDGTILELIDLLR